MVDSVKLIRTNTSSSPVSVAFISSLLVDLSLLEPQDMEQIRECILDINDDHDKDDLECLLQNLRYLVREIRNYKLRGQDRTDRNARATEIRNANKASKSEKSKLVTQETDGA